MINWNDEIKKQNKELTDALIENTMKIFELDKEDAILFLKEMVTIQISPN